MNNSLPLDEKTISMKNSAFLSKPLEPEDTAAWKTALYAVKFMKESALNDFFLAYYGTDDGKPTERSNQWIGRPKKEKVAKLRELLSNLSEPVKWSIVNSNAGHEVDKKANDVQKGIGFASMGSLVSSIPFITKLVTWVNPLVGVLWSVGISALLTGSSIATKIIAKHKKNSINRDYLVNQLVQERDIKKLTEGTELSICQYLLDDYKSFCNSL